MKILRKLFTLISLALLSSGAYAHSGHAEAISFFSGFLHPITGWDHLLTILLVSFWSAFTLKRIWLGPALFMGGMFLGVFLGLAQYTITWFELGIAISIMGMGILIYFNRRFDFNFSLSLISIFGIFHGYAHANSLGNSSASIGLILLDLCGLLIATAALHAIGVLLGKKVNILNSLAYRGIGISAAVIGMVTTLFV
jgi:urease accessory protein